MQIVGGLEVENGAKPRVVEVCPRRVALGDDGHRKASVQEARKKTGPGQHDFLGHRRGADDAGDVRAPLG